MRRSRPMHEITCYFRAAEGIGLLILGVLSITLTLCLRKRAPY